jgi:hypothetical protein
MTRRDALMAVAARVEALTGPCQETDFAIARATPGCKNWTASLDAAMTLAKGRQVRLLISEDGIASALVGDNASTAATPALALTAAALRALAAQGQTDD